LTTTREAIDKLLRSRGRTPALSQEASQAARDRALADVERGAPEDWLDAAFKTVHWLALRYPYLTADDVWARGLGHPREARALGPVFKRAQGRQLVEPTALFVPTAQVARHRSPVRVWRSKLVEARGFVVDQLYSRQVMAGTAR